MKLGVLILAGGKSKRMSYNDKARLAFYQDTFLNHIHKQFANFPNTYISIRKEESYADIHGLKLVDEYEGIGPLSGIVSAFHQSDIDTFFTIACDMPFIRAALVDELLTYLHGYDGVFVREGRYLHALGGIYTRKMLPVMESHIVQGEYALQRCIQECNVHSIDIHALSCTTKEFENINTIEDYQRLFEN